MWGECMTEVRVGEEQSLKKKKHAGVKSTNRYHVSNRIWGWGCALAMKVMVLGEAPLK